MPHIRPDGQWLEFIGGLLTTPLMALPADRIALQLTESFGLVGDSYEWSFALLDALISV